MTDVLIVAKTHMKERFCVGGLALDDGRGMRLLTHRGDNLPLSTKFEVGDVWELKVKPIAAKRLKPPHTEDVCVVRRRSRYRISIPEVIDIVGQSVDVPTGKPNELFCGLLQFTRSKRGRILADGDIPAFSTCFWRMEEDLFLRKTVRDGKARHYYRSAQDNFEVRYVGVELPQAILPGKTLLRFSLSRWFREIPGFWLQLSGWYL